MVGLKITGLPIHGWRDDSLHMRQKRKKKVWWGYSKSQDELNVNKTDDQIFMNTFL